jgi:DNA-binding PadR family transcriptional regulator
MENRMTAARANVDGFLPLRPVEFLVLAVLHDEELHGYGIVQEIARRTAGRVTVKPGNLYRVLDRLMERGLLRESTQRSAPDLGDERRRYYAITELGTEVVHAEAEVFGAIAADVRGAPATTGNR